MHQWNRCAAIALGAVVFMIAGSRTLAQNLLVNPSFEDPITMDGPPFVGFWEGFSGGAGASAANSTVTPRTGAQSLELMIAGVDNTFTGAFQDVTGLTPGSPTTFSGYHRTPDSPTVFGLGIEYRIEWRDSTTDTEISRTPNMTTPVPTDAYALFSLDAAVPAGADTARIVYAIQTFGGEPNPTNTGTVYLDDLSFVVIPEPASLALVGVSGLGLLRRRRRGS